MCVCVVLVVCRAAKVPEETCNKQSSQRPSKPQGAAFGGVNHWYQVISEGRHMQHRSWIQEHTLSDSDRNWWTLFFFSFCAANKMFSCFCMWCCPDKQSVQHAMQIVFLCEAVINAFLPFGSSRAECKRLFYAKQTRKVKKKKKKEKKSN